MRKASQRGFALLYFMLFVIPVLLLGASVALDFARYNLDSAAIQNALDEAAMHAYKYFPYRDEAVQAGKRYLALKYPAVFGGNAENANVTARGDSITIRYAGASSLLFGPLLGSLSGRPASKQLPLLATAQASATPFDVTILFDASSYMSPALGSTVAWGTELNWPAADFFRSTHITRHAGAPVEPRVATQQCFSPPLWAEKRAVISAYTYFANFDNDQIGVGVYPGLKEEVSFLRKTRAARSAEATDARSGAEAQLPAYGSSDKADWLCSAAFERELSIAGYRLPAKPQGLDEWLSPPSAPNLMTVPPDYRFDPLYAKYASLKQAVWGTVSRHMVADFPTVLQYLTTSLLAAPSLPSRRNLGGQTVRYGFIFSGSLPHVSGQRWQPGNAADLRLGQSLKSLTAMVESALQDQKIRLKIYLLIFDHEGTAGAPAGPWMGALESSMKLNTRWNGAPGEKFELVSLYVQSADALNHKLLPALLTGQRSVTLSY